MAARSTFTPDQTRNLALLGHRGSGKTSLAEALLAKAGAVRSPGRVDDGTSLLDHDEEERRRHLTLQTGFAWIEWDGGLLHLADTPGSASLIHERALAIAGAEVAVVVVDSAEQLSIGAEQALAQTTRAGVPTIVFVNKVDRPHDLGSLIDGVTRASNVRAVPVEAPLGERGQCTGVIDLLGGGCDMRVGDAPGEIHRWLTPFSERLTEAVALTDDALLEKYLDSVEIPQSELHAALAAAIAKVEVVPVLFGSALEGFGVERLLNFLTRYTPTAASRRSPIAMEYDGTPVGLGVEGDFVGQLVSTQLDSDGKRVHLVRVWRGTAPINRDWVNGDTGESGKVRKLYKVRGPRRATANYAGAGALVATWDPLPGRPGATFTMGERLILPPPEPPPSMMAYALYPRSDRDGRQLKGALNELLSMDAALEVLADETTGRLLLRGASDAHLDLALNRLRTRLGVDVEACLPPIPYREVPAGSVNGIDGIHRKEDNDGLPVEYGACRVDISPLAPDDGIGFEDAFDDPEELPRKFRPAIDEGVRRAMERGPMAGYPVLGAQIKLTGGEYDILQSTEDHFRIAGELAGRSALAATGTRLLEPWWQVDVYARGGEVGGVIGEISNRRGRIIGMEVHGNETRVCAHVPFRELRTFGPRLQQLSSGRGRFYGEFSHYETAPDHIVGEAIADSPFREAS